MIRKPPARGRSANNAKAPPPAPSQTPPEVLVVRPPVAWNMLGIAASTGWKWVREGKIKVVRVGPNCTMVPVAELRDFIARHTVPTSLPNVPDAAD
jgi:hypothetical protein